MDKRLPLAIFLSFLVLLVWARFGSRNEQPVTPPAVQEAAGATGEQGAAPADAGAGAVPTPTPVASTEPDPQAADVEGDSEERELELNVGTPGQPGSYLARFSNRGAALLELRLADSFDAPDLSDAERTDPGRWTHLLDSISIPESAGAPGSQRVSTGSLVLRATDRRLEPAALDEALWTMRELSATDGPGVEFELGSGGLVYRKRVRFRPGEYELYFELEIENRSRAASGRSQYQLTPASIVPLASGDRFYREPQAVALSWEHPKRLKNETAKPDGKKPGAPFNLPSAPLSFAGVQNKYFAVLLFAESEIGRHTMVDAYWRSVYDQTFADENPPQRAKAWRYLATDVLLQLDVPPSGEKRVWDYVVYAGPKNPATLQASNPHFGALVQNDLGFFSRIAGLLVSVLNFFQRLTGNWGVAIILLTVTVRMVLFPLNRRSQTAMARYQKKMKRVQPMIEELKKKHAGKPDKLRQEQAELMRKEGAFPPLGGCLPMFFQLPIFFGLFSALRASYPLRHAPFFGWIHDLSMPDRLMRIDLNTHLPLIGTIEYLNILPPLMVVLWILQQRTMPKPADEQAAKMQRMMMWMPVFMGFFLYDYAAGLSLYMITQSTLGIVEMGVIKRIWPIDDTELPPKKEGFMARIAEKQKEVERLHQQKATRGRPQTGAQKRKKDKQRARKR